MLIFQNELSVIKRLSKTLISTPASPSCLCYNVSQSQGGQWENVFVEQGYFTSDMLSKDYFRWLYTALTRTTKKLHLINFKKEFFE